MGRVQRFAGGREREYVDESGALQDLQEELAFQSQSLQKLNDALALQQQDLLLLKKQLSLLADELRALRAAAGTSPAGDGGDVDVKPPHY